MKKLMALVLVFALGLLPALALAENWIGDALDAGRSLSTVIKVDGVDELAPYCLVFNEQKDGSELRIEKDGEALLYTKQGFADEGRTMYFTASPLGDKTYAFGEGDLVYLLEEIEGLLEEAEILPENMIENMDKILGNLSSAETAAPVIDLTELDLTKLLLALTNLKDCVRVTDVEDYEVDQARFGAEYDEEAGVAAARAEGHEVPALGTVCTEVIITLTADDAQTLVNALCATIADNPVLAVTGEDYLAAFTEVQESFIDRMSDDLVIQVGLDAESEPVFASLGFALDGEVMRTYAFESAFAADDETGAAIVTFNGMYSDDDEDTYTYLFDAFVLVEGDAVTAEATLGDVDAEHVTLTAELLMPELVGNKEAWSGSIALKGNYADTPLDFKLTGDCVTKRYGDDATREAVFTLLSADTAIAAMTVEQTTVEPMEPVDLKKAVYPAEMDAKKLPKLGTELLENAVSWFAGLTDTPEEAE